MESRNRDRIRDPREEILLESNFDDEGVTTHAYNSNPNRRRSQYRSEVSIDRFSEGSLHGNNYKGGECFVVVLNMCPSVHHKCIDLFMCTISVVVVL